MANTDRIWLSSELNNPTSVPERVGPEGTEEKAMRQKEIEESIHNSISIHIKDAINGLRFDRTEPAEIVDNSQATRGLYTVYNGSTRYVAHSENTQYSVGNKVYVTIVNNDYSQEKWIIGRVKSNNSDAPLNYVAPLDQIHRDEDSDLFFFANGYDLHYDAPNNISENTLKTAWEKYRLASADWDNSNVFDHSFIDNIEGKSYILQNLTTGTGLTANGNLQYKLLFMSKSLRTSPYNKGHNRLGVSAEFKTLLNGYGLDHNSGHYGLLILIYYSYKLDGGNTVSRYDVRACKLDSSEMLGAIYNFDTWYEQQAVFELETDNQLDITIHNIAVLLYQDKNFTVNGELLDGDNIPDFDNILVRNIGVWAGDEITPEIDVLNIQCSGGIFYDSALNKDSNLKRLTLKWNHKDPNDQIQVIENSRTLPRVEYSTDDSIVQHVYWYATSVKGLDTEHNFEMVDNNSSSTEEKTDEDDEAARLDNAIVKYRKYIGGENRAIWKKEVLDYYNEAMAEYGKGTTNAIEAEQKYITNWKKFRDNYQSEHQDLILPKEEIDLIITSLNLKQSLDYYYDRVEDLYILTPNGESKVENAVSKRKKESKTTISKVVSDKLGGTGWELFSVDSYVVDYMPDMERNDCKVKCIVEYGPIINEEDAKDWGAIDRKNFFYRKIESDPIIFTNVTNIPDAATLDAQAKIKFSFDGINKESGSYNLYDGTTGDIKSAANLTITNTINIDLVSTYKKLSYLKGTGEKILWIIPKNSMLRGVELLNTVSNDIVTREQVTESNKDKLFWAFNSTNVSYDFVNYKYFLFTNIKQGQIGNYGFSFTVDSVHKPDLSICHVQVYINVNNYVFNDSTDLIFSRYGSNGTDYTFNFYLGGERYDIIEEGKSPKVVLKGLGGHNTLVVNDKCWRELIIEFLDTNSQRIELTTEQKKEAIAEDSRLEFKYLDQGIFVRLKQDIQQRVTNFRNLILTATMTYKNAYNYTRKKVVTPIHFTQYLPIIVSKKDEKRSGEFAPYILSSGNGYLFYEESGAAKTSNITDYRLDGYEEDFDKVSFPKKYDFLEGFNSFIQEQKKLSNVVYLKNPKYFGKGDAYDLTGGEEITHPEYWPGTWSLDEEHGTTDNPEYHSFDFFPYTERLSNSIKQRTFYLLNNNLTFEFDPSESFIEKYIFKGNTHKVDNGSIKDLITELNNIVEQEIKWYEYEKNIYVHESCLNAILRYEKRHSDEDFHFHSDNKEDPITILIDKFWKEAGKLINNALALENPDILDHSEVLYGQSLNSSIYDTKSEVALGNGGETIDLSEKIVGGESTIDQLNGLDKLIEIYLARRPIILPDGRSIQPGCFPRSYVFSEDTMNHYDFAKNLDFSDFFYKRLNAVWENILIYKRLVSYLNQYQKRIERIFFNDKKYALFTVLLKNKSDFVNVSNFETQASDIEDPISYSENPPEEEEEIVEDEEDIEEVTDDDTSSYLKRQMLGTHPRFIRGKDETAEKDSNLGNTLFYPTIYLSNFEDRAVYIIECHLLSSTNISWNENADPVLTMPLMLIKNKFDIPMVNNWNGSLTIDEENNSIMASSFAAGHKESDNSFTGIIMGDLVNNNNKVTTGLFGYQKCNQSFGFKSDGTAFIGRSGLGRISFDGNKGLLQSGSYIITKKDNSSDESAWRGTNFDLTNGNLYLYSNIGTIKLQPTNKTKLFNISVYKRKENGEYEIINGKKNNVSLINVSSDKGYFLQSVNYENGKGFRLDLSAGEITSKGKIAIEGGKDSYIKFSNPDAIEDRMEIFKDQIQFFGTEDTFVRNLTISGKNGIKGTYYDMAVGSHIQYNWFINSEGNISCGNIECNQLRSSDCQNLTFNRASEVNQETGEIKKYDPLSLNYNTFAAMWNCITEITNLNEEITNLKKDIKKIKETLGIPSSSDNNDEEDGGE